MHYFITWEVSVKYIEENCVNPQPQLTEDSALFHLSTILLWIQTDNAVWDNNFAEY